MYPYLPLSDMEPAGLLLAEDRKHAGTTGRDFLAAFRVAEGNPNGISEMLDGKRRHFLMRQLAKIEVGRLPLWKEGNPTQIHLSLVIWGFSPTPWKWEDFVDDWRRRNPGAPQKVSEE